MATNILALPELSMPCSIESNMDWLDSIVFFDAAGNALPLDGIAFRLQVRVDADLPDVLVDASTANGLLQILSSGFTATLGSPGSGYQIGDRIFLGGGVAVSPAVVAVSSLTVLSFQFHQSLATGSGTTGEGHTVGEVITLVPAASNTPVQSTAPVIVGVDSVDANGTILTYHIISGGSFTATPTSNGFLAPFKAGYASQHFFSIASYGIGSITLVDPGIYRAQPSNPAPQGSTTGTGSGATFNLAQVNNAVAILIPAGALVHPLIEAAGVYQIQAMADGYTQNVASGPMTVTQGIVR